MKVRWTMPAFQDLKAITRRIGKENPSAARNIAKTIFDAGNALELFPQRGRDRNGRTAGAYRRERCARAIAPRQRPSAEGRQEDFHVRSAGP